jgi:plastocyanin
MKRRSFVVAVCAAFGSGCAGGTATSDAGPPRTTTGTASGDADATVVMTDEPTFDPTSVEIETGETVLWRNESTRFHTVTAYGGRIPSNAEYFASGGYPDETLASVLYPLGGRIEPDGTFRHTFETPGEHVYYSIPAEYQGMTGRVVVR